MLKLLRSHRRSGTGWLEGALAFWHLWSRDPVRRGEAEGCVGAEAWRRPVCAVCDWFSVRKIIMDEIKPLVQRSWSPPSAQLQEGTSPSSHKKLWIWGFWWNSDMCPAVLYFVLMSLQSFDSILLQLITRQLLSFCQEFSSHSSSPPPFCLGVLPLPLQCCFFLRI